MWVGGFRNFLNSELWVCARGDVRVPSPLCVAALRPSRQNASAPFGAAVCAHRACKREGEDNLWRHHTLGLHLTPLDAPCVRRLWWRTVWLRQRLGGDVTFRCYFLRRVSLLLFETLLRDFDCHS